MKERRVQVSRTELQQGPHLGRVVGLVQWEEGVDRLEGLRQVINHALLLDLEARVYEQVQGLRAGLHKGLGLHCQHLVDDLDTPKYKVVSGRPSNLNVSPF